MKAFKELSWISRGMEPASTSLLWREHNSNRFWELVRLDVPDFPRDSWELHGKKILTRRRSREPVPGGDEPDRNRSAAAPRFPGGAWMRLMPQAGGRRWGPGERPGWGTARVRMRGRVSPPAGGGERRRVRRAAGRLRIQVGGSRGEGCGREGAARISPAAPGGRGAEEPPPSSRAPGAAPLAGRGGRSRLGAPRGRWVAAGRRARRREASAGEEGRGLGRQGDKGRRGPVLRD